MTKLTFFIGSHVTPNVILDVSNMGWMLESTFDLDLVARDCSEVHDNFGRFDVHTFVGDSKSAEVRGLYTYLQTNDTDAVIQVSEPTQHGWIVALLSKYAGCKFFYRYDTDAFYSFRPRRGMDKVKYFGLHNVLGRVPPRLADGCIVLGPTGKERLRRRGVPADRIGVLPPSISRERLDPGDWEPASALEGIPQENIVLFIGRLNRLKGFYFLMDAIPEIVRHREDIHFLVIGNGDQPAVSEEIEDHVTFTGFVDPSELGRYLAFGDALVVPSYREGLPRVILEALCTDLTVVARGVGEIPSVTRNLFSNRSEFVEMVCSFEDLPQDSCVDYYREALQQTHIEFFDDTVGR